MSLTNWLSDLIQATPQTKNFPTEGIMQEAEAINYLASSLQEIYKQAHSSDPEAKRLMYERINRSFHLLSGKPYAKPAAIASTQAVEKPKPLSHVERVKLTVDLLVEKRRELRKYRIEECSKLMKAEDKPGKRDPVSKMEPAKVKIEEMIKVFNDEVKTWNAKLPNLVKKLDNRYKLKIVPNRVMITPEKVKEIKRDTGLSATTIVNSVGAHVKHQEELEDKKKALEEGLTKAYEAFAEFERQINRAIDAYKYGGVAGNETLSNKGIGLPHDPNLKDVKFTDIFRVKNVEEVRKQILDEKAKKAALPKAAAKKPAPAKKVKQLKSPAEKDAPEHAIAAKPAAAAASSTPKTEKKS